MCLQRRPPLVQPGADVDPPVDRRLRFAERVAVVHRLVGVEHLVIGRSRCSGSLGQAPHGVAVHRRLEDAGAPGSELALFPDWLAFRNKIRTLTAIASCAGQYWYYAQIDRSGRSGMAEPALSVFQATKETMALQKSLLRQRS